MTKQNTSDELKAIIFEVALIYRAIIYHHIYLSMDRGIKLNSFLYNYCNIYKKKMNYGRTKTESIVKNILSPSSIELAIQDLKMFIAFQNNSNFSFVIDTLNNNS